MAKFADHDAYIEAAPEAMQPLLVQLRTQLAKALPDADEIIAYDMPGFAIEGKTIAGYAAFSKQCGLYISKGAIVAHADDIAKAGLKASKTGVTFTAAKQIPEKLVKKLSLASRLELLPSRNKSPTRSTQQTDHSPTKKGVKKSSHKIADGPTKELFTDGKVSGEGKLKADKRQGKWKFYHRNGQTKAVGKYVDGELDGYWEWWRENGMPLQAGAFSRNVQVGLWKRYYDNGQLWDEGEYLDGKKVGPWTTYDKSGAVKQQKTFKKK